LHGRATHGHFFKNLQNLLFRGCQIGFLKHAIFYEDLA
jgi:hypothetical protein